MALSGGLDSAVAAVLLKRQGWRVGGVHLRLTPVHRVPDSLQAFAHRHGLDLTIIDVHADFHRLVIDYFLQGYRQGRTPNPCVRCNALIKFARLRELARSWGVPYLATGHYVRAAALPGGETALLQGLDPAKDQSYFLHRLPPALLPQLVFPLGGLTKAAVTAHARRWGLEPYLQTSESQDNCFIPQRSYREFLHAQQCPGLDQPGDIVDRRGRVLGRHRGLENYTVGQRRGLGLPAAHPYYVLALDPPANRLVVGPRAELFSAGLLAADVHWLGPPPREPFTARVRLRYRHPGVDCRIIPQPDGRLRVLFALPQAAVTPGQAAVFYQDERLLGGGWIEAPLP